jgi:hypothetical protein
LMRQTLRIVARTLRAAAFLSIRLLRLH